MSNFLQQMAESSTERAAAASISARDLDRPVHRLNLESFDVIAEVKSASPSEGKLAGKGFSRRAQAHAYADGGAAAISVLTEPSHFGGDLSHIEDVANAVETEQIPVMRKDFLVKPVQVLEARAAGASGVLLIAALLSDQRLGNMLACAFEHSMFVLLECFDEADLKRCTRLLDNENHAERAANNRLLFGVNTRNLRNLEVDRSRLARLARKLPRGIVNVAESGLQHADDAVDVVDWGYRAALVGSALMKSDDPAGLISSMLESGRTRVGA